MARSVEYMAVGASCLLSPLLGLYPGATACGFSMWPGPLTTKRPISEGEHPKRESQVAVISFL